MKMRKDPSLKRNTNPTKMERYSNSGQMRKPIRDKEVYQTKQWRTLRKEVMTRWTACVWCGQGGAEICDHIIPVQADPSKKWDIRNLQPMHRHCHQEKTNTIDAPSSQPLNYRHDLAHTADRRPQAMKDWAEDMYQHSIYGAMDRAEDDEPVTFC